MEKESTGLVGKNKTLLTCENKANKKTMYWYQITGYRCIGLKQSHHNDKFTLAVCCKDCHIDKF